MVTEIIHKLIGKIALILTAAFISITVQADETTIGSLTYETYTDGTAIVIDCKSSISGKLTVPGIISSWGKKYSVVAIGEEAFYWCSKITHITLPDSITTIGDYAFQGCRILSSINLPDSLTSIGDYAFSSCSLLKEILIPDSVTEIGYGAFSSCSSLKEILVSENNPSYRLIDGVLCSKDGTYLLAYPPQKSGTSYIIPDSVTVISSSTFSSCELLTSITIPKSLTSLYIYTFSSCPSLKEIKVHSDNPSYKDIDGVLFTKSGSMLHSYPPGNPRTSYTIPDSVRSIGCGAFNNCNLLTEILIPDSVVSIGNWTFSSCSSLISITLPDSITSVGAGLFAWCDSLTSVKISDSLTSPLSLQTFYGCGSLTNVVIGKKVPAIGNYVFSGCVSLTEIIIPESVTQIGVSAFGSCRALKKIYFQSQTPPEVDSTTFSSCPSSMVFYYPAGAEDNWGKTWQGHFTKPWNSDPESGGAVAGPKLTRTPISQDPQTGVLSFILTFDGTLQDSADGIKWKDVTAASRGSCYVVIRKNQNRFFRAVYK